VRQELIEVLNRDWADQIVSTSAESVPDLFSLLLRASRAGITRPYPEDACHTWQFIRGIRSVLADSPSAYACCREEWFSFLRALADLRHQNHDVHVGAICPEDASASDIARRKWCHESSALLELAFSFDAIRMLLLALALGRNLGSLQCLPRPAWPLIRDFLPDAPLSDLFQQSGSLLMLTADADRRFSLCVK